MAANMRRNREYSNNYNHHHHHSSYNRNSRKSDFVEDLEAAFFLGKLNKHHDREQVYTQLRKLTRSLDFYICKFDMPNGIDKYGNKSGNKGFAFVHTKTKEQAQRIISMKYIRLGNQECEVKPYGGRTLESGRGTPDSGTCIRVGAKFENPLKRDENLSEENLEEVRSRMNSGIQVSESDRSVSTRNVSESETNEEMQEKISLEPEQNKKVEINYEQQASLASSHNDDAEFHDYWLEKQTEFVMTKIGGSDFDFKILEFKSKCDYYFKVLMSSNNQTVREVQDILYSPQSVDCVM